VNIGAMKRRQRHEGKAVTGRAPSSHYVALAGEFFVLGELALRRLDGTLTLGPTKEIDILVLNRATGRTFRLEVKTGGSGIRRNHIFRSYGYEWFMNERHAHLEAPDLVYCFVRLDARLERQRFFLVPSADVASYIRWEYRHWRRHSKRQTGKVSPMRTFRVPVEESPRMALPQSWRDGRWRRWKDNWAIFGPTRG